MSTILHNIVRFTGLTVGVPIALPHKLNRNGVPAVPKIGATNAGGFTVTADATNVTVTRGASAGPAVDVYVEVWHSIEDAEPPGGLDALIPFIIESSVGGGGPPTGPATAIAFFDAGGLLSGDAAKFYLDLATKDVFIGGANGTARVFVNQAASFNSNAGLQHSSDVANRAQYRGNQFGNNTGVPGVTGFKSRGLIGTLASVLAGEVLWRATAIGVARQRTRVSRSQVRSRSTLLHHCLLAATTYRRTSRSRSFRSPDRSTHDVPFSLSTPKACFTSRRAQMRWQASPSLERVERSSWRTHASRRTHVSR